MRVPTKPKTNVKRVAAHRARLRQAGLRPIQIWVPDTRMPGFAAEARRQSLRVAKARGESQDQAFIDSISEHDPA
jgi:hypothetical protein